MDKEVATLVWNTPTKTYLDYADSFEEFVYRMHEIVKACKVLHKRTPWEELASCLCSRFEKDWTTVDCYNRSKHLVKSWTDLSMKLNDFGEDGFRANRRPDAYADELDFKEVLTTICRWRVYDTSQHQKHDWICDAEMLDDVFCSINFDDKNVCKKQVKSFLSFFEL